MARAPAGEGKPLEMTTCRLRQQDADVDVGFFDDSFAHMSSMGPVVGGSDTAISQMPIL